MHACWVSLSASYEVLNAISDSLFFKKMFNEEENNISFKEDILKKLFYY